MTRRRPVVTAAVAVLLGSALALPTLATSGLPSTAAAVTGEYGFQGEGRDLVDVDRRAGRLAPTRAQQAAAQALGADVRWGALGTPSTVSKVRGHLSAAREGAAADVARAFLREQTALLGLSAAEVDALELLNDTPLYDAPDLARLRDGKAALNTDVAHVVTFRQRFGALPAAQDGLAIVGVTRKGEVTYLTSTLTRSTEVTGSRSLSAVEAYVAAARDVRREVRAADVELVTERDANGFTTFTVPGTSDLQYARLRALPTPRDGVRTVWEVVVLDASADAEEGHEEEGHEEEGHEGEGRDPHGHAEQPTAFISFVDADNGEVLFRTNRVDHAAQGMRVQPRLQASAPASGPVMGATDATGAGQTDAHRFQVPAGNRSITLAVNGNPNGPANDGDVVVSIDRLEADGSRTRVASQDLLTAEALVYSPAGGVRAGTYFAVVDAFVKNAGAVTYAGYFQPSAATTGVLRFEPRWEVFPANPPLDGSGEDTRQTWCWVDGEGCDLVVGNDASRAPWDVDTRTGRPTFTTTGNNARTAPSYVSFLTPDAGAAVQPLSPERDYDFPFTNQWQTSACDPKSFVSPQRNDLDAASVNLFVGHNRIHDWGYFLGFTERTYNLQTNNFGNQQAEPGTLPGDNDPELGQTQAGALQGPPAFSGRDNANQITLQDGIPGITNQYLWQPIQAAFYAPCVDGAYDQSVIAHEYGHAIQNRMVGGPDAGLSGNQARSMGESWSDLTAIEYLNAYGFVPTGGENPFAVGPYVTGDGENGIRNFNMSTSPLNYSNIEYDGNGVAAVSPHANGEIWSATNYRIRERLDADYDAQFDAQDKALLRRCADGELPSDACPGSRRWAQIMHDAFLLQQSATDMTTARDAYLAADRLRFDGANQTSLWEVFASRGLGAGALSKGTNDVNPRPGFDSPVSDNGTLTFTGSSASGGAAPQGLKVYVGHYEARSFPAATSTVDTSTTSALTIVPGTYDFTVTAPGFATTTFTHEVGAGPATLDVPLRENLAAGRPVTGDAFVNKEALVDGTEGSNAALLGTGIAGKALVVELDGPQEVTEVAVSAALRPTNAANTGDPAAQNRFSALRSFAIETCAATQTVACDEPGQFTEVLRAVDAFPGDRPRPTVGDLDLRSFAVTPSTATHVRLVVLENQCTGAEVYSGGENPDADPLNDPDCVKGVNAVVRSQAMNVRVAELQVLGGQAVAPTPGATQSPAPEVTASPTPDETVSPSPEATVSPEPTPEETGSASPRPTPRKSKKPKD